MRFLYSEGVRKAGFNCISTICNNLDKKEVSSIDLHTHVQYKNSVQINIFPGVINSSHRKNFFMTVQFILTKSHINLDEKRGVHLLACKLLF